MPRVLNGLIVIAIIASLGVAIYQIALGVREWNHNNRQPVTDLSATVASKRKEAEEELTPSDDNHFPQSPPPQYFVTFTLDTGESREFLVTELKYDALRVGDSGTLSFQGTRYLGFRSP